MNVKMAGLIIALLFITASVGQATPSELIVNLHSQASVDTENLTLGQIAEITGDEAIVAKAKGVGLGRISVPGQKITIERSVVLSRLACSEIAGSKPVLTGAETVVVSRKEKTVTADRLVESALSFLANNAGEKSIARWEPARIPDDVILPNQPKDIKLVPRLLSQTSDGKASVEVSVLADGKPAGARLIVFNAKYNSRRIVTIEAVAAGETITANNTKIETVLSDEPQKADWSVPYGFVATRNLAAGTVIGPGMVKQARPQVKIERNQSVVIRLDRPGLVVTAMGKAMQQGVLGEQIKVRNIDSQRVILARVNEDGTVEPVF